MPCLPQKNCALSNWWDTMMLSNKPVAYVSVLGPYIEVLIPAQQKSQMVAPDADIGMKCCETFFF